MPISKVSGFKKVESHDKFGNLSFGFYFVMAIVYGKVLSMDITTTDIGARAISRLYKRRHPKAQVKVFAFANMWEMTEL